MPELPSIKVCFHCSANKETESFSFEQCKRYHTKSKSLGGNGWNDIGYNLYIERSGKASLGRKFGDQLAHAKGHNTGFIAICYEGGLDDDGNPKDTRTLQQKQAIRIWLLAIKTLYKIEWIGGHRDLSEDANDDGVITPDEWMKACPCFDAGEEYSIYY